MTTRENGSEQQLDLARMPSVNYSLQHFSRTDYVDALEKPYRKGMRGGRNITNQWFADDIDTLAENEMELEALVESLDKPEKAEDGDQC